MYTGSVIESLLCHRVYMCHPVYTGSVIHSLLCHPIYMCHRVYTGSVIEMLLCHPVYICVYMWCRNECYCHPVYTGSVIEMAVRQHHMNKLFYWAIVYRCHGLSVIVSPCVYMCVYMWCSKCDRDVIVSPCVCMCIECYCVTLCIQEV